MRIRRIAMLAGAGLLWFAVSACDSNKTTAAPATAEPGAAAATSEADGTVHKPPIQKSEVTDGHYYCDMGTVHYSRAHQGDGKCPLCKMDLTKK